MQPAKLPAAHSGGIVKRVRVNCAGAGEIERNIDFFSRETMSFMAYVERRQVLILQEKEGRTV